MFYVYSHCSCEILMPCMIFDVSCFHEGLYLLLYLMGKGVTSSGQCIDTSDSTAIYFMQLG